MRIAIIDDVTSERKLLRDRLEMQIARRRLHAEISEYKNGSDFLAAARKKSFELAFLDIYMEGENGVETAEKLREFDSECLLVFVTSSTDHALDGFRVRAIQYLVKPYSQGALETLLNEILKRLPAADLYLKLSTTSGPIRLRLHEILYAEHFQHHIYIYTSDGRTYSVRQTLREFAANLDDKRFITCNRGTIINMEYAEDLDGTSFLLKNGKEIPVSRNLSNAVRQSFADFLFERGKI